MSETDQIQIVHLDARSLPVRIGLIIAVLSALLFGWFSIRWQLGNLLAELTVPTESNAREIAELAKSFAPADPLTNWLAAGTEKDVFTDEKIESSLQGFEQTVRLSPFDYRWWVELGRAYEQADKIPAAETAYRQAVLLAPEYTYPHWQLGNFYLRQNRSDEAFAELKKAAANNMVYRQQVFSIAWDFFGQDTERLEEIAGEFPASKTTLTQFYALKGRAEDSLRVWNTLSDEEKRDNEVIARVVAQVLFDRRYFRSAIEFVRSLGIEPKARAETIQNGGFEDPIGATEQIYFDWRVAQREKLDIKLDPTEKREGSRSLRVMFNGYSNAQMDNVYQTVTVTPGADYSLNFWLKTENLKSGGTPLLEIVNANDDKIIAASKPFPTDTNDWHEVKIEFTAPENAEAVNIRTARAYCGEACPIFGTFWYDDFRLEKIKSEKAEK